MTAQALTQRVGARAEEISEAGFGHAVGYTEHLRCNGNWT
jgi:hypothetical protein